MNTSYKPYISILAKPNFTCNMKCPACYLTYGRLERNGKMSSEVLNSLIQSACGLDTQNLSFQWIGGESLLVGIPFYEEANRLTKLYAQPETYVEHCIQTNGSLIDEKWIRFFKEHSNFSLSISFEITRNLQEQIRPMRRSNLSSFDIVKKNIDLLNNAGVRFGVLTIITLDTIKIDPQEWLYNVVAGGIRNVGLQLCYQDSYWGNLEQAKLYMNWLDKLFIVQSEWNCSVNDEKERVLIRESYYLYNNIRGLNVRAGSCHNSLAPCSEFLVIVDTDGNTFALCDAYVGLKNDKIDFYLGNVLKENLETMFCSSKMKLVKNFLKKEKASCKECESFFLCNGGCPVFRNMIPKDGKLISSDNQSSYCLIQRGMFSYVTDIAKRNIIRQAYNHLEKNEELEVNFIKKKIEKNLSV